LSKSTRHLSIFRGIVNRGNLKIGIKYCGGCNPEYDRVGLVRHIKEKLKGSGVSFSYESREADLVVAVQGCETACADLSGLDPQKIRIITDPEQAQKLVQEISWLVDKDNTEDENPDG
jgi:hypothetical protein